MKMVLFINFKNSETGETADNNFEINMDDKRTCSLATACKINPCQDTFTNYLKALYDNPCMDGTNVGIAYQQLWDKFSHYAFTKLGWHDVTADVYDIILDGERMGLNCMIDAGTIDAEQFSLQLTREGFMYCYA